MACDPVTGAKRNPRQSINCLNTTATIVYKDCTLSDLEFSKERLVYSIQPCAKTHALITQHNVDVMAKQSSGEESGKITLSFNL